MWCATSTSTVWVREGAYLHDEAAEVVRLLQRGRQLELLGVHLLRQQPCSLLQLVGLPQAKALPSDIGSFC